MASVSAAIDEFLAQPRIAVAGVGAVSTSDATAEQEDAED